MAGKVAVVLPCYNAERWLKMTLVSLFNQYYDNYKIFAVNDGSTDNSEAILREFESLNPDKMVVINQPNLGCGDALNAGFDAANEEGGYDYGTMVSADNLYYPNFISSLAQALDLEPETTAMVYADFNYIDENNHVLDTVIHKPLNTGNLIYGYDQGMAFMFRMSAKNQAGQYWRRICEDYDMAVRISQYGSFELVSLVLAAFRVSQQQLTGSNNEEEKRAAEHSRRLARILVDQRKDVSLEGVYPDGVDPYKHRFDNDVSKVENEGKPLDED